MAAIVTTKTVVVSLKLDNGTTSTGATKTVTVSYPAINKDTFDADKALAIEELLEPVLSKGVVEILKTEVSRVMFDE